MDLECDPGETKDHSGHPAYGMRLKEWRRRMIAHLEPRAPHYPGCTCHPDATEEQA